MPPMNAMLQWLKEKISKRPRLRAATVGRGFRRLSYVLGAAAVLVLGLVAVSDDGTHTNGLEKTWNMAKDGFARIPAHAVALATGQSVEAILPEETLPGFLYIEAPQLYTRERLVNDRFRQANWLSEELKRTNKPVENLDFSAPSRVARETKASRLMVQLGEGKVQAAETGQSNSDAAKPTVELDQLKLLERRLHYRAELRNELMDTQLDDGHDLDGNTLYRLNFDAVAMPWADSRSNPGAALFIVTARQPEWRTALKTLSPGSEAKSETEAEAAAKAEAEAKAETEYDSNLKQSLDDDSGAFAYLAEGNAGFSCPRAQVSHRRLQGDGRPVKPDRSEGGHRPGLVLESYLDRELSGPSGRSGRIRFRV